jgi:hypothetical protein
LMLAIEVDGITHEDEKVLIKDPIRQDEIEMHGVTFLRFNALDVVHDMKNVIRAIENWIFEFEEINGVSNAVERKRNYLPHPKNRKRNNLPPTPPGRG